MSTMTEIFGDVIASYTRADALQDGALVSLDELAGQYGFQWPVAVTAAAHLDLIRWDEATDGHAQDETGRAWDVLTIVKMIALPRLCRMVQETGEVPQRFETFVWRVPRGSKSGAPRRGRMSVVVGSGDGGQPCITVMLPDED